MKSRKFFTPALALVSLFVLGFTAQVAAVPVLYGVVTGFGSGGGQDPTGGTSGGGAGTGGGGGGGDLSFLVTVDQTNGGLTTVGEIGFGGSLSSLAADSGNNLYSARGGRRSGIPRADGTCCRGDEESALISINPQTGAGTSVGLTDIENRLADPSDPDPPGEFDQFGSQRQNVSDLSFDPNDSLFGIVARGTQLGNFDDVRASTGFADKVGDTICAGSSCSRGNALAFDELGTLFLAATIADQTWLSPLDPATGAPLGVGEVLVDFNLLGSPGPAMEFRIGGMDFNPQTGELWVAVTQGEPGQAPAANSILGILNTTTGEVNPIGETGRKLSGLAFVDVPASVPEPTTLLLLGLGLAGLGFSRRNVH